MQIVDLISSSRAEGSTSGTNSPRSTCISQDLYIANAGTYKTHARTSAASTTSRKTRVALRGAFHPATPCHSLRRLLDKECTPTYSGVDRRLVVQICTRGIRTACQCRKGTKHCKFALNTMAFAEAKRMISCLMMLACLVPTELLAAIQ